MLKSLNLRASLFRTAYASSVNMSIICSEYVIRLSVLSDCVLIFCTAQTSEWNTNRFAPRAAARVLRTFSVKFLSGLAHRRTVREDWTPNTVFFFLLWSFLLFCLSLFCGCVKRGKPHITGDSFRVLFGLQIENSVEGDSTSNTDRLNSQSLKSTNNSSNLRKGKNTRNEKYCV